MKGGTLTLMIFATLVPLLITASVLLVSYTSSCSLADYGDAVPPTYYGEEELQDAVRRLSHRGQQRRRPRSGCTGRRFSAAASQAPSTATITWPWWSRRSSSSSSDPSSTADAKSSSSGSSTLQETKEQVTHSDVRYNQVRNMEIDAQDARELRQASSRFDFSDPRTAVLLQLVKWYTRGWEPVRDPRHAAGVRSAWSADHVRMAAHNNSVMACCVHVRVVEGKVYLRYAGPQSLTAQYRLDRANDLFSFLQATLDRFALAQVRADFLLNTCDHALAREGMGDAVRSNYLVWTPHVAETLDADLVVPDLLDLRPQYMKSRQEMAEMRRAGRPWADRISKAVFRGATTNYWLRLSNWVSSPRLRLHRLSHALPELLDAGVTRWSHAPPDSIRDIESNGGIFLADQMNETQKSEFKYELIVDGGMGGGRLCGVLLTDRALVMQDSPFIQFFYPLLKRGLHFFETDHYFRNLPALLRYLQSHDDEVREMIERVHRELAWTCSIEGRMLAFAVLLVKYHSLQDPGFYRTGVSDPRHLELVQPPTPEQTCRWGPATHNVHYLKLPRDWSVECPWRQEPRFLEIAGCPTDCNKGLLEEDWRWVSSDQLEGVEGMDWWKTYIPEK